MKRRWVFKQANEDQTSFNINRLILHNGNLRLQCILHCTLTRNKERLKESKDRVSAPSFQKDEKEQTDGWMDDQDLDTN